MLRRIASLGSLIALALALAGVGEAGAAESPVASTLVQALRDRRPDIARWETAPMERSPALPAAAAGDVVLVGRIGARTPVRFADGRVRWYAVTGYRAVPVSRHVIASGAPLAAEDAVYAERDVIGAPCEPVSLDAGKRWRATRYLATGEALCTHSVAQAPDVAREQAVALSTQRGAISVTRTLVAATDANAGERVRLRDPATGDIVVAIVTGAGTARLEGR